MPSLPSLEALLRWVLPSRVLIYSNYHASPLFYLVSLQVFIYFQHLDDSWNSYKSGLDAQRCKGHKPVRNTQHCTCTVCKRWLFVVVTILVEV